MNNGDIFSDENVSYQGQCGKKRWQNALVVEWSIRQIVYLECQNKKKISSQ